MSDWMIATFVLALTVAFIFGVFCGAGVLMASREYKIGESVLKKAKP